MNFIIRSFAILKQSTNAKRLIVLIVLTTFLLVLPVIIYMSEFSRKGETGSTEPRLTDAWVFQLLLNLAGYASVLVPGYLLIQVIHRTGYLQRAGDGCFTRLIRMCVLGSPASSSDGSHGSKHASVEQKSQTLLEQCGLVVYCSGGLLLSYLGWGLLQERIMAYEYFDKTVEVIVNTSTNGLSEPTVRGEHFRNSLFLEFMNRILAVVIALVLVSVTTQPRHSAPIYKYSYNSFSNVMSSWCQYEALKYVSFPVQVLAKTSKVIPVMLMGRLVSRRTFTVLEYVTAAMISVGLFLFLISSDDAFKVRGSGNQLAGGFATFSGIALMSGYLLFDSFTSNWQGELFRVHHMTHIQMMAGSNVFSVLFTSVSLLEQGGFTEAFSFIQRHPSFLLHIAVLAVASSIGQLFIFYTIDRFGPVTFTIIMTVRQAFSILLSCIIYGHPVHFIGVVGVVICFTAIFLRTYYSFNKTKKVSNIDHLKASTLTEGIPKGGVSVA